MNFIFKHHNLGIENSQFAILQGLDIHTQNPELEDLKKSELQAVLSRDTDYFSEIEVNKGYYELLKSYPHKKLTPAGLNFVQIIKKRERFPTINTAVDSYNLVVAQSFLSIGAHDLDSIAGDIVFDYAHEGEKIPAVNMTDEFSVLAGDYVYRDDEKILAWLDVRDTDLAKISKDTKNIVLIIEGNTRTSFEYIQKHLKRACELIVKFNGGTYTMGSIT